ncbi:MAG TPA: ParB/RepB/Spo0J family partition protein [Nitrososphaerales archaeon]|nr:ParB/RepB/Spo0J family partition protein [Nitrososphaerales archaeon]
MLRAQFSSYEVSEIPLDQVTESSSLMLRTETDQSEGFEALSLSIRKQGIIQPILVRPIRSNSDTEEILSPSPSARYEIICGNRRYVACKRLGFSKVPAIIRDICNREALEVALVENLQRENLNPVEEAEAFKKYVVNFGRGSITSLAARIGKSEEYVSHRLLMLGLPKEILEKISRRLLKTGQACELVWLKDPTKQTLLANRIVEEGLSFRQTRSIVKMIRDGRETVSEAVRKVVRPKSTSNDINEAQSLHSDLETDFDGQRSDRDDSEHQEKQVLKHAILILRTCLSGLDGLLGETESPEIHDALLKERTMVHGCLDRVINAQVASRRASHNNYGIRKLDLKK